MHRTKLLAFVALLVVASSSTAHAAGYELMEQSAVAQGRVLAVMARLDDPSTAFFNPAGLAFLSTDLQVSLGTTLVFPSFKYSDPAGHFPDAETQTSLATPVNFYAAYKPIEDLGIGVAVTYPPWGNDILWPDDFAGNYQASYVSLVIPVINIAAAYKIKDVVSIGAAFTLSPSTIELEQKLGVVDDSGMLDEVTARLAGTGMGYSFMAGIQARPMDRLYLGLVYKYKISVDFEGIADFTTPDIADKQLFQDQDVKTNFTTPMVLGFSAGYQILDNWYLETGFHYTFWSVNEELVVDFPQDDSGQLSFTKAQDWENGFCFRLGNDIDVVTMDGVPLLTARIGGGYDMSPVPDSTLSPILPGSDRVFGAVGLQFNHLASGLYAATSYQVTRFMPREVSAADNQDDFGQKYDSWAHLLAFSIGIKAL